MFEKIEQDDRYGFSTPEFIGKSYLLEDATMYIDQSAPSSDWSVTSFAEFLPVDTDYDETERDVPFLGLPVVDAQDFDLYGLVAGALDSLVGAINLADSLNSFVRAQIREESFYRQALRPRPVTNDDLDRALNTPSIPQVRFDEEQSNLSEQNQLDIRQTLADKAIQEMIAEEDARFINAVNSVMSLPVKFVKSDDWLPPPDWAVNSTVAPPVGFVKKFDDGLPPPEWYARTPAELAAQQVRDTATGMKPMRKVSI